MGKLSIYENFRLGGRPIQGCTSGGLRTHNLVIGTAADSVHAHDQKHAVGSTLLVILLIKVVGISGRLLLQFVTTP